MENNKFQKVGIKNRMCYYFNGIIKIEDFDFNVLLNGNLYENILIPSVLY